MNCQQIKNIYEANSLNNYKLCSHDDLLKVHGVNISHIDGYSTLTQSNKNIFDVFIVNFLNAWGLEARASLIPKSINYILSEEYLGKENDSDDYFISLGTKLTAIYENGNSKVLKISKDKKYKNISCKETEKQNYLRFEYRINGHSEWMHVISETKWY